MKIIDIREYPEWLDMAADYFSSKWGVPRHLYHQSMAESLTTQSPVPRWYLMLEQDKVIGGFGMIENDFMQNPGQWPWLCALYLEPDWRGRRLGAKMLEFARREAGKMGLAKLFLNTEHIGFYEKYSWRYLGMFPHQSGENVRVYEADSIPAEAGEAEPREPGKEG